MEATVFREQIVNFLEAAVVFLLVTNALSIAATTYAIQLLNGLSGAKREQGALRQAEPEEDRPRGLRRPWVMTTGTRLKREGRKSPCSTCNGASSSCCSAA